MVEAVVERVVDSSCVRDGSSSLGRRLILQLLDRARWERLARVRELAEAAVVAEMEVRVAWCEDHWDDCVVVGGKTKKEDKMDWVGVETGRGTMGAEGEEEQY